MYDDLRAEVSLLIQYGHHRVARHYPIGTIWREANLVRKRVANMLATEATVMRAAMVSVMAKSGGKDFNEMIEDLNNG